MARYRALRLGIEVDSFARVWNWAGGGGQRVLGLKRKPYGAARGISSAYCERGRKEYARITSVAVFSMQDGKLWVRSHHGEIRIPTTTSAIATMTAETRLTSRRCWQTRVSNEAQQGQTETSSGTVACECQLRWVDRTMFGARRRSNEVEVRGEDVRDCRARTVSQSHI